MCWTVVLKSPLLLFHHGICLNTCCLYCSMLIGFHEVWWNWRLHIFQVTVCNPVWIHWWVEEAVYLPAKHGYVGTCKSEVYSLMKLVSAWLKVVFLQCVLASFWDLLLVVHEEIVYQLSLHLCNPLYVWQLVSYDTENLWGLPEWSGCEVQLVASSGWCRVNWWCCRARWCPDCIHY